MPDFPRVIGDKIPDPLATPITELVTVYRPCIDLIRKELAKEIEAHKRVERADPHFGDDVHLLRFIIPNYKKGFDKVKKYLKRTMEWRAQHADTLDQYRKGTAPISDDKFGPFMVGGAHYRNADGHFVVLMRSGLENNDTILEEGRKQSELLEYFLDLNEAVYALIDAASRAENKFFVTIDLIDYNHGSMSTMGCGKYRDATTDSTKLSETYYPLTMGKTVIFNMPTVLKAIITMVMFVMPKSMQETTLICGETDPKEILAFAKKHLNLDPKDIPTYLGGQCNCEGGCCMGVPNDRTQLLTVDEIKTRQTPSWTEYLGRFCNRPEGK